ncbi:hypothetical protein BKA66DRAFT_477785 [Pyrenochaeta sp. MPI-SDFR-AT-0127]|nr:hypothetical protein BKA66DRAFT_477785 [Pyrenochaeta sp. MPI-SDFR-AT-0127]
MFSKLLILVNFVLYLACGDASDTPSTSNRTYLRPCPWPKCSSCPSSEQLIAPGIGFALEMGYGTAAVRWHNGTLQPIAQVPGSSPYLQLMKQLSSTTRETRFPHNLPTTARKVQPPRKPQNRNPRRNASTVKSIR